MPRISNKSIRDFKLNDWDVIEYDNVDSTNEEIKRLYSFQSYKKLIVISNSQSQGKGRYGRKWTSPYNSGLYVSWLVQDIDNFNLTIVPLLACLACIRSLKKLNCNQVFVKWPNDLIFDGKKLGGILIEPYKKHLIIGIGINLLNNGDYPPTSIALCEINRNFSKDFTTLRNEVLNSLTLELEQVLYLSGHKDIDLALSEISSYLTTPSGSLIKFLMGNEILSGKVIGLNSFGQLEVEVAKKGIVALKSEEISLLK